MRTQCEGRRQWHLIPLAVGKRRFQPTSCPPPFPSSRPSASGQTNMLDPRPVAQGRRIPTRLSYCLRVIPHTPTITRMAAHSRFCIGVMSSIRERDDAYVIAVNRVVAANCRNTHHIGGGEIDGHIVLTQFCSGIRPIGFPILNLIWTPVVPSGPVFVCGPVHAPGEPGVDCARGGSYEINLEILGCSKCGMGSEFPGVSALRHIGLNGPRPRLFSPGTTLFCRMEIQAGTVGVCEAVKEDIGRIRICHLPDNSPDV